MLSVGHIIVAVIDLHAHVLPGIDDGPDSLEGSVELCRAAAAEGTRTIAATPHLREDHPRVRPAELSERCRTVNERLASAAVDLDVVPGGEVDLLWAQSASSEDLRLVSYGQRGTDLLVETPYDPLPQGFEDLLFQVALRGYRVLLAHPERSRAFQADPARLEQIVGRGTLVQVTALSLVNPNRRSRSRALGLALVERGLAHVIASDAHSAAWRAPQLAAGVAAGERVAPARARWMVTDAPAAILAGETLPAPPAAPHRGRTRRLFARGR